MLKVFKSFSLIATGMAIVGILEYGFLFETSLALALSVLLFVLTSLSNQTKNTKDKNKRIWKCIKIFILMLFRPVDNIETPLADKTYKYGIKGIRNIKTNTTECSYREIWSEMKEYVGGYLE